MGHAEFQFRELEFQMADIGLSRHRYEAVSSPLIFVLRRFGKSVMPRRNVFALIVIGASGCQGTNYFAPPGPINQQQANAIVHDPFPQGDIGPVDLANRPPGYEQPLPEAVRNRIVPDAMPWLGQQ